MKRDEIFDKPIDEIAPFSFAEATAAVFDDMLVRSIPHYNEVQELIAQLVKKHCKASNIFIDLGCSTGITIQTLMKKIDFPLKFVAVDASSAMIEKAKFNCQSYNVEWHCKTIQEMDFPPSSFINCAWILQFLNPSERITILKKLRNSLISGGVLFIAEKCRQADMTTEELFVDRYHNFKRRNGYSQLAIDQKRESLKNVLQPVTLEEIQEELTEVGFKRQIMPLRFYNFHVLYMIKEEE